MPGGCACGWGGSLLQLGKLAVALVDPPRLLLLYYTRYTPSPPSLTLLYTPK